MKPHYFTQDEADEDDFMLDMCKAQGYVPQTCLLAGDLVWLLINDAKDPCTGCKGPRVKCHGRPE